MTPDARNAIVTQYMPLVDRIIESLPELRRLGIDDDCRQAGYEALIRYVDSRAATSAESWDDGAHVWLKQYVVRDVLREKKRQVEAGIDKIDISELDSVVDSDELLHTESDLDIHTALIENPDNEDLERQDLLARLLDGILELETRKERMLMLAVLAGYSVAEAGRAVKLREGAAKRLYDRTVEALRQRFVAEDSPVWVVS